MGQEAITETDVLIKQLEMYFDQSRNFELEVFQSVYQLLGIRKTKTTSLHPQSFEIVEMMNQSMGKYLSEVQPLEGLGRVSIYGLSVRCA